MHLNYYFIRLISSRLNDILTGKSLLASFSQNKDELILEFGNDSVPSFYIKALLSNAFTCLSFPDDFQRARKNSVDLFKSLVKEKVTQVVQYENERAFSLKFENGHELVFKLYGNRSNILLFNKEGFLDMFNSQFEQDSSISLPLDKKSEVNLEQFTGDPDIRKWFPTLRGLPEQYLQSKSYSGLDINGQWNLILETLDSLRNGKKFFLIRLDGRLHLSLLPFGELDSTFENVVSASNAFYSTYLKEETFSKERNKVISFIKNEILKSKNYIFKTEKKLKSLKEGTNYHQIGDLLMANLHKIERHASSVLLNDFYTGKEITIKLKSTESPQKNAENYYRKAKNQFKEIQNLEENISSRKRKLDELIKEENNAQGIESRKDLKVFSRGTIKSSSRTQVAVPYWEKEILGFRILIGKNARSNDKLLNSFTHKEDLWLHVKDAAGSHVIIKQNSGKTFSGELIEKAAQIAAHYSKRKTEALVPVSYTPRKFVRKRKGDPPGLVVVEKEKIILVEPSE